jgi:hypothetical protein
MITNAASRAALDLQAAGQVRGEHAAGVEFGPELWISPSRQGGTSRDP